MKSMWIGVLLAAVAVVSVHCKEVIIEERIVIVEVERLISAEVGGTIETPDGKAVLHIPSDALEEDTHVKLTLYEKAGFPQKADLVSEIVEMTPAGLTFARPVSLTMTLNTDHTEVPTGKQVTPALLRENIHWTHRGNVISPHPGDPHMAAPVKAGTVLETGKAMEMHMGHFSAVAFLLVSDWEDPEDPEDTGTDVDTNTEDTADTAIAQVDCVPGEYVLEEATATSERVCAVCTEGYSVERNAEACTPWTVCEAGQFFVAEGTATRDRVCAVCPDGSWDHDGDPATDCVAWRHCEAGEVIETEGTPTTDRICTPEGE